MNRFESHQNLITHEEAMRLGSGEMLRRLWKSHPRIMSHLRATCPFELHTRGETL